jgi:hypothetical protein
MLPAIATAINGDPAASKINTMTTTWITTHFHFIAAPSLFSLVVGINLLT